MFCRRDPDPCRTVTLATLAGKERPGISARPTESSTPPCEVCEIESTKDHDDRLLFPSPRNHYLTRTIGDGSVTCIGERLPHLRPTTPQPSIQHDGPPPRAAEFRRPAPAMVGGLRTGHLGTADRPVTRRPTLLGAIVPPPGEHRGHPVALCLRILLARLALHVSPAVRFHCVCSSEAHHAIPHVCPCFPPCVTASKCWSEHCHACSRDTGIRESGRGGIVACFFPAVEFVFAPPDLFFGALQICF